MTNALIGGVIALSLLVQGDLTKKPPREAAGPYSHLFTIKPPETKSVVAVQLDVARQALSALRGGRVERGPCNMPMIRGDARLDPKSIVPIQRGNTEARIRAIQPSVCWDARPPEEVIK